MLKFLVYLIIFVSFDFVRSVIISIFRIEKRKIFNKRIMAYRNTACL